MMKPGIGVEILVLLGTVCMLQGFTESNNVTASDVDDDDTHSNDVTICDEGDFPCYKDTLEASTETAHVLLSPLTTNHDGHLEECFMYWAIRDCIIYEGTAEGCNSYEPHADQPDSAAMMTFKEICYDESKYLMANDCISNNFVRAHTHLCMDYALEPERQEESDFCGHLGLAVTCAYHTIALRCGEIVAKFLTPVQNASLYTLQRRNGCDISIAGDERIYITLGMMFIAFIFIPLFIRYTWCPPNQRSQHDVQVMDKMLTQWKT